MSQTLDEFIKEVKEDLTEFETYWRNENKNNAEYFPLEMMDGNEGLWLEFFQERHHDK